LRFGGRISRKEGECPGYAWNSRKDGECRAMPGKAGKMENAGLCLEKQGIRGTAGKGEMKSGY